MSDIRRFSNNVESALKMFTSFKSCFCAKIESRYSITILSSRESVDILNVWYYCVWVRACVRAHMKQNFPIKFPFSNRAMPVTCAKLKTTKLELQILCPMNSLTQNFPKWNLVTRIPIADKLPLPVNSFLQGGGGIT